MPLQPNRMIRRQVIPICRGNPSKSGIGLHQSNSSGTVESSQYNQICVLFRAKRVSVSRYWNRPVYVRSFIRSFVRLLETKSAPRISGKLFDLESPNCMGTSIPALSTSKPDMMLLSISDRSKSHKHETLGSYSGDDFSIVVQPILKGFTDLETVIQGLHFLLYNLLDIFAP